MERRAKKLILCFGVAVAVVVLSISLAVSLDHSPYAYLSKFHPQRVEVDTDKAFQSAPGFKGRLPAMTMLVFDFKDAPAVLSALKHEFTTQHGFSRSEQGSRGGAEYEFWPSGVTPPGKMLLGPGVTFFCSGPAAQSKRRSFDPSGPDSVTASAEPGCIVVYTHEGRWFDKIASSIRSFLHL